MPFAWTDIPDGDIDPDSPLTTPLMTAYRDNDYALAEGAAGAPKIQTAAYAIGSVDSAAIGVGEVGASELDASLIPWTLIDSDIISGGTQALLEGMDGTYGEYLVVAYNLTRAGSASGLLCRVRESSADVGTQFTFFTIGQTGVDEESDMMFITFKPRTTKTKKVVMTGYDGYADVILTGLANPVYTGVIDGYRFYTSGNSPFTGTFKLYGR